MINMNTIEKKIKNAILEVENLRFVYPNKDNQYRIEQARLMKIIGIKSRSELDKWIKMWKMEE